MNFFVTSVLLFYAILKDLIWTPITLERVDTCWTYKILIHTIFVALAVMCLVLFLFCMAPFILLKLFVHIHLKRTYGALYGGILDGHSAIYEAYDDKKVGIVTMMIVFINGRYYDFYKQLRMAVDRMCVENKKLSSKVAVFCGYQFYLNQRFTSKDILSDISIAGCKYITRNQLMDYLENYSITSDKLWEVIVFKQPIAWNVKLTYRTFGVMLRMNHCLVDGYHLTGLVKKYLLDFKPIPFQRTICECQNKKLNLDDAYILDNPIKFLGSGNVVLRTWPKQFITTYIEQEIKYVPIIKKIKNKLLVPFSVVLLAAIYSAIADFMRERCCCWDKIDIFYNLRPNIKETEEILKGTYMSEQVKNCYTTLSVVLNLKKCHSNPSTLLTYVSEEYKYSKESMSEQLVEFLAHYVWSYLPVPLIKRPFEYDCYTRNIVHFSNMLQLQEETMFGNRMIDVFSFMPLYCSKGMMLSVITYDGRLEMTLVGREGIIASREELKCIMKNAVSFIDNLANEVMINEEMR